MAENYTDGIGKSLISAKAIVISLGGSLLCPDAPDVVFLSSFAGFAKKNFAETKAVIVCGGGATARKYMAAAKQAGSPDDELLDWMGIESTKLNAMLLKAALGNFAAKKIMNDPTKKISFGKNQVVLYSGWKPGHSTDNDAVIIAKNMGVKFVLNLSNQDYVYTADPNVNHSAKPLLKISWKQFMEMFDGKWKPGMHIPFDIVGAKIAAKEKIKIIVAHGRNISNTENIIAGRPFKGTIIGD